MDIATLVHYGLAYFDANMNEAAELDQYVFAGYLEGLKHEGWKGDQRVIRFAYTAQLAFGPGLLEISPVLRLALEPSQHEWAEGFYGKPVIQILERRAEMSEFLLRIADEVRSLTDMLPK